ncbi:SDR family NAD(P)-dependent oxidoreductase [Pelagibius marinus]|uniref:SDR family NAD(P)-dependent oxidoreductase n=1 Tax=Pelagibius marinus TaxID=2762760 RepID=UPI001872E555|nr:SDR family oxidoreductase [Pelagibius marinus]
MDQMTPTVDFTAALGPDFDLTGKTAFIPGGYGGLGEAIAWGLALRGARVVVAGRHRDRGEALAEKLKAAGHDAGAEVLDATQTAEIRGAVDRVAERFGGPDILVNCVGINIEEAMVDVTETSFDEVYTANVKSAMFLGQAVARRQIAAGCGGKQVHMLSVSSHRGFFGRGYSAYCTSKGALVMLVRQHALELAQHGICVNGVAPTYVMTEMIREKMADPKLAEELRASIPAGRIAEPVDVAGPTVFLCSPAADFVTGQVLYVDGGISANR